MLLSCLLEYMRDVLGQSQGSVNVKDVKEIMVEGIESVLDPREITGKQKQNRPHPAL